MDARKLISFGKNSYIVSIPKAWAQKNMLKKGDLLTVKEGNDEIIFSTNNKPQKTEPKTIIIEAKDKSINLIKAEIVTAYLNNYDSIEIISENLQENAKTIKRTIRDLSGLEIMMQTSKRIVANDLLNISEISTKTIIKRMDFIARAMIEDSIGCLDGNDQYEDINQRDADVNRLHFLAYRVIRAAIKEPSIMRAFKTNHLELYTEKSIVMRIEKIADRQKRIARYLKDIALEEKQKEVLKEIYNTIRKSYLDVMKAHYTKDKDLAMQVEVTNRDRILMCDDFLKENGECFTGLDEKSFSEFMKNKNVNCCTGLAKIVENLKAMATSIKYIARTIIGMD